MSNKYFNIQKLISLWEQYENDTQKPDFQTFGRLLCDNKIYDDKEKKLKSESISNEEILNIQQQFLVLITRLSRIHDIFCKKFFEGLPINTLLEFNFLSYINKESTCNKSEVIYQNLVEYTTGIDVLKRLTKLDLILESKDELDKRKKKIKITSEGKKILMESLLRIRRIQELILEEISINEIEKSLHLFKKIESKHNQIATKNSEKAYSNILYARNNNQ